MHRKAHPLAALVVAGRTAAAHVCRPSVWVNVVTLATFVVGSVGLPVGERVECRGGSTRAVCSSGVGDAIRPMTVEGCRCSRTSQAQGACCCRGKQPVVPAKRSCCATPKPSRAASCCKVDSPTSETPATPVWTSCPCGPKSTSVLFVSADPRLLPAMIALSPEVPSPEFAPPPRLLDSQAILAPEPRPPRLASC